jgi:prevent-host-death family protein
MYIARSEPSSMQKNLALSEARVKLSQIINGVLYDRDTYIISKQGTPAAAVVPLDVLEQWQTERARLFEVMDEVHEQNQDLDPDELMEIIVEAQQAVRTETANT